MPSICRRCALPSSGPICLSCQALEEEETSRENMRRRREAKQGADSPPPRIRRTPDIRLTPPVILSTLTEDGVDLLLKQLYINHGEPRLDIAPELEERPRS